MKLAFFVFATVTLSSVECGLYFLHQLTGFVEPLNRYYPRLTYGRPKSDLIHLSHLPPHVLERFNHAELYKAPIHDLEALVKLHKSDRELKEMGRVYQYAQLSRGRTLNEIEALYNLSGEQVKRLSNDKWNDAPLAFLLALAETDNQPRWKWKAAKHGIPLAITDALTKYDYKDLIRENYFDEASANQALKKLAADKVQKNGNTDPGYRKEILQKKLLTQEQLDGLFIKLQNHQYNKVVRALHDSGIQFSENARLDEIIQIGLFASQYPLLTQGRTPEEIATLQGFSLYELEQLGEVQKNVGKNYMILGITGSGGESQVLKARHNNEYVALKVWNRRDRPEEFLEKSQSPYLLKSTWIKSFESEGEPYHVTQMPFLDLSLAQLIKKAGSKRVSSYPKLAARIALHLLKGLNDLHKLGVLHNDIKPANIMIRLEKPLDPNANFDEIVGELMEADFVIADFGGSTVSENGISKTTFGTRSYMSPERLQHGTGSKEGDYYAFGVTLYEAWTGDPNGFYISPQEDRKAVASFLILRTIPSFKHSIDGSLSDEAYGFLKKLITIDPKERWTFDQLIQHPFLRGTEAS